MHFEISEIIRSRRKTIAVEVHDDASVIVRAPGWVSKNAIRKFLEEKSVWIYKKLKEARENMKRVPSRNYVNGEKFFYLGDSYELQVIDDMDAPLTLNNSFMLSGQYRERAREIFTDWYRDEAERIIPKRVELILSMSGQKYKRMKITDAERRWGSCTEGGNINFSFFLVMAPMRAIDYVIAHEISHLSELNHSENFWNRVHSLIPDFEEQKTWFRENEHLFVL